MFTLIILLCLPNSFSGCPKNLAPPANTIRYEHLSPEYCAKRREELLEKFHAVYCVPEKN